MNDFTRYARVQPSVASLVSSNATHVSSLGRGPRELLPPEEFRRSQRAMASAVLEEKRPGVFFFAHHAALGNIGRLWLEAGAEPRVGTIGRHAAVDLALPLDDELSLRHVLFVVRAVAGEVRLTVLDLASSGGVEAGGEALRRFDVAGPTSFLVGGFRVYCFPTGGAPAWDVDAADPFATLALAPRTLAKPRAWETPRQRRLRQVAGCLGVVFGDLRSDRAITEDDLERGVLIGRHPRCDLRLPEGRVSRVHAALLRVDGRLLLVDAGSTNGLWRAGEQEVHCVSWGAGDPIELFDVAKLEWSDAQ